MEIEHVRLRYVDFELTTIKPLLYTLNRRPMRFHSLLLALTMVAIGLAGCTDDGGDSDPEPTPDPQPDPNPSPNPGQPSPSEPEPEEDPEPIELSGTVSGVADCQLVGQGQAALMGSSESIPAEAYGRSYTLSVVDDGTLPVPIPITSVCLYIDGASASTSGTVPDQASSFEIYADGALAGVGYSILIE